MSLPKRRPKAKAARGTTPPRKRRLPLFLLGLLGVLIGAAYYYFYGSPKKFESVDDDTVESTPACQVVDLPGRGKGLVATRDIERGELVFREEPLLLLPVDYSPMTIISEALQILNSSERAELFELSYVKAPPSPSEAEIALAILQTNAVAAGQAQAGLFPRMARLNHACGRAFNMVYSWREAEGVLVVHALKKVRKGEELLTSYTDTKRPRNDRRAFLKEHYDFHCTCATCSLSPEESALSDERLSNMSHGIERLATWGHRAINGKEAIRIVHEIWDWSEEEQYWSERGRLAADAAWVAAAHMDDQATREWAKLAAWWYGHELGTDSEHVKEMEGVSEDPTLHQAWGQRAKMKVGGPEGRG